MTATATNEIRYLRRGMTLRCHMIVGTSWEKFDAGDPVMVMSHRNDGTVQVMTLGGVAVVGNEDLREGIDHE